MTIMPCPCAVAPASAITASLRDHQALDAKNPGQDVAFVVGPAAHAEAGGFELHGGRIESGLRAGRGDTAVDGAFEFARPSANSA